MNVFLTCLYMLNISAKAVICWPKLSSFLALSTPCTSFLNTRHCMSCWSPLCRGACVPREGMGWHPGLHLLRHIYEPKQPSWDSYYSVKWQKVPFQSLAKYIYRRSNYVWLAPDRQVIDVGILTISADGSILIPAPLLDFPIRSCRKTYFKRHCLLYDIYVPRSLGES
jgi:hypothetical protein